MTIIANLHFFSIISLFRRYNILVLGDLVYILYISILCRLWCKPTNIFGKTSKFNYVISRFNDPVFALLGPVMSYASLSEQSSFYSLLVLWQVQLHTSRKIECNFFKRNVFMAYMAYDFDQIS